MPSNIGLKIVSFFILFISFLDLNAKQKSFESVDNIYKPTLNIGANLLKLDGDTRAVQVGTTTTGFVKFGVNLYDGGSSSSVKKQKNMNMKQQFLIQNHLQKILYCK